MALERYAGTQLGKHAAFQLHAIIDATNIDIDPFFFKNGHPLRKLKDFANTLTQKTVGRTLRCSFEGQSHQIATDIASDSPNAMARFCSWLRGLCTTCHLVELRANAVTYALAFYKDLDSRVVDEELINCLDFILLRSLKDARSHLNLLALATLVKLVRRKSSYKISQQVILQVIQLLLSPRQRVVCLSARVVDQAFAVSKASQDVRHHLVSNDLMAALKAATLYNTNLRTRITAARALYSVVSRSSCPVIELNDVFNLMLDPLGSRQLTIFCAALFWHISEASNNSLESALVFLQTQTSPETGLAADVLCNAYNCPLRLNALLEYIRCPKYSSFVPFCLELALYRALVEADSLGYQELLTELNKCIESPDVVVCSAAIKCLAKLPSQIAQALDSSMLDTVTDLVLDQCLGPRGPALGSSLIEFLRCASKQAQWEEPLERLIQRASLAVSQDSHPNVYNTLAVLQGTKVKTGDLGCSLWVLERAIQDNKVNIQHEQEQVEACLGVRRSLDFYHLDRLLNIVALLLSNNYNRLEVPRSLLVETILQLDTGQPSRAFSTVIERVCYLTRFGALDRPWDDLPRVREAFSSWMPGDAESKSPTPPLKIS